MLIGKLRVDNGPPKLDPHPAMYILSHTSTKKAVGEISGVPLPVPTTVDRNTEVKYSSKTAINWLAPLSK